MSRSVWSKHELARRESPNDRTSLGQAIGSPFDSALPREAPPAPFEELFRRHYRTIRGLLDGHAGPGLGLVAVGPEGLEAKAWFSASQDDATFVILGRHRAAEIFLPWDVRLSLRHLAVILHRHHPPNPVRFRVLDLRTALAFSDENGRPLEAISSEGPVMMRCASFAILIFPSDGSSPSWPEDADAAWKRVPERVYIDPLAADPEGWLEDPPPPAAVDAAVAIDVNSITLVPSFPGPVFPARDLGDSEPARGELIVRSGAGRVALRLGARAARRGVLLGRYARCDTAGLPVLSNHNLSRVHLLLIEVDGVLYAVDTASTNGSWLDSGSLRSARMLPGVRVGLADQATVEWRVFH